MAQEDLKEKIAALVERFDKDKAHYLSKDYLEAEVRQDFLDPFFAALGWDIGNKKGLSPFDREVVVEKGETSGRPDYNFRVGGATKFFVEAKAPSVALDNVKHIFQAKTYAWNHTGVWFVILTDFEGFKLFDASLKPNSSHPNDGLIYDFRYTDYLVKIDKLLLLSREEVEAGSLERLVHRDVKSKRLRVPVDKAFLEDMTSWRESLAKDIHKRNTGLDVKLLNESVQKLLDRIIFIRIAEDRKIRRPRELQECVELWKAEGKRKSLLKDHLRDLFAEVNADLNGDIFKPHACETVDVDSALLAEIIEELYFPKCRYRFEVLGVELLGSIYERYLGNTIRVTPKRVVVEEKPEVRKAGGVYYTPKYIVDYIVKNTVDKLIEGKTPNEIARIKILDPACGSGSFLLGAYQCLLDYHLEYYREHPKEAARLKNMPLLYYKQLPEDISLPIQEKARILRNCIYGVDIDAQAVEITMMSLYLKALEGERSLLPEKQSLLPPLNQNIKCGNSLIGYDVLEQGDLFDDEVKDRINPFDWTSKTSGFGEIMETGGFDAVVGNPPYVRQEMLGEFKPYFQTHYKTYHGVADLYVYFIEQAHRVLRQNGLFGFICSNKFMRANYGKPLRDFLAEKTKIHKIVDFGELPIFENAATFPAILLTEKQITKKQKFIYAPIKQLSFQSLEAEATLMGEQLDCRSLSGDNWTLASGAEINIFEKMKKIGVPLGDYVKGKIYRGVLTGLNEAFVIDAETRKRLIKEDPKSTDLIKPFVVGDDVRKYRINLTNERFLIFTRRGVNIQNYPAIHKYLNEFREALTPRPKSWKGGNWKGRKPGQYEWYEIQDTVDYYKEFEKPKIVWPEIAKESRFDFDNEGYYLNKTCFFSPANDLYLLGILNSKQIWFYMKSLCSVLGDTDKGGRLMQQKIYIETLPIRAIDFKKPADKAVHDKLVSLVERMLELHKKKNALPPSAEREKVEREIAVTDERIDDVVYGLYGITSDERKMIEGKA